VIGESRLAWIDQARGVGICLVVIGHCLRGMNEAGIVDAPFFHAIDGRLYAFPCQFFLCCQACFFYSNSAENQRHLC